MFVVRALGATTLLLVIFSMLACSGVPNKSAADTCARRLDVAYSELDFAEAQGFGGTVSWAKAAGTLARAKTHQALEKYESCTRLANEARTYIELSKKPH